MPNRISVKSYKRTYTVNVKCPRCEEWRTETWKAKPDMREPRVMCDKCRYLLGEGHDVIGLSLRSHTAQNHKRKAA